MTSRVSVGLRPPLGPPPRELPPPSPHRHDAITDAVERLFALERGGAGCPVCAAAPPDASDPGDPVPRTVTP